LRKVHGGCLRWEGLHSSHVPGTVVVGVQWGDEGKAKVIDLLSHEADMVVRYQGGHNAGHTVVVDGQKFAFRLTPSGILFPHVTPVIGNGVVLDNATLFAELDMLESRNVDTSRLVVSGNAHMIMPWHPILDGLEEIRRGSEAIGTTKNGIGPAYVDKVAREGLRVQDLLSPDRFRARLANALEQKNALLTRVYDHEPLVAAEIEELYLGVFAPRLSRYIGDSVNVIHDALRAGKNVLFEGAQATFLDIDHGTYPFVTSSNPVAGSACAGAGVGPRDLGRIIGIAKAYVTRVGGGPFPTELLDATGELIVERGQEFGTVTGRRRRPGWFDAVMLRHAVKLNSLTEIALTKLDILDVLETVRVCVAYSVDGVEHRNLPSDVGMLERAVPVYVDMPGWQADTTQARSVDELPVAAQNYVRFLARESEAPISILGIGPGRDEVMNVPAAWLDQAGESR
jgi:adenylosuccinate synthase